MITKDNPAPGLLDRIRKQLPQAVKATRENAALSQAEKQRRLAILLLLAILTETEPFSLAPIVAESSLPDSVTNHAATVLGAGQGGKGGMGLWKTNKGYLPCRENAVLVLEHVTDAMLSDFLDERGWDEAEFISRVEALPMMAGAA